MSKSWNGYTRSSFLAESKFPLLKLNWIAVWVQCLGSKGKPFVQNYTTLYYIKSSSIPAQNLPVHFLPYAPPATAASLQRWQQSGPRCSLLPPHLCRPHLWISCAESYAPNCSTNVPTNNTITAATTQHHFHNYSDAGKRDESLMQEKKQLQKKKNESGMQHAQHTKTLITKSHCRSIVFNAQITPNMLIKIWNS